MGGQTAGFRKSQPAMANTTAYCSREDPTAFYMIHDYQIAGLIIFVVGFCGATANYTVVFLIDKVFSVLLRLQNAFGRLTLNQAIGEAVHLTVFTFYFAPTVFFDIKLLKSPEISRIFGHINLICYDICIYSHLVISINRLTAIYFPFKYNTVFSETNVRITVIVIWILAVLPTFYLYIIEDCRFIYSDDFWNFTFTNSPACAYTDFLKYVSTVALIAFLDIITFAKVRFSTSKVSISDAAARKKRHDEINFVKQVCLQGVVFVLELNTYFIIVNYVEGKWNKFFLTTFAWEMVHSCDGYITLLFNKGFFRVIRSRIQTYGSTDTQHPVTIEKHSTQH